MALASSPAFHAIIYTVFYTTCINTRDVACSVCMWLCKYGSWLWMWWRDWTRFNLHAKEWREQRGTHFRIHWHYCGPSNELILDLFWLIDCLTFYSSPSIIIILMYAGKGPWPSYIFIDRQRERRKNDNRAWIYLVSSTSPPESRRDDPMGRAHQASNGR